MRKETKIEEVPFEEAEYCIFDFETTGTSGRQDKVIEIGMVKIRAGKIVWDLNGLAANLIKK